jgi:hypothetical protein
MALSKRVHHVGVGHVKDRRALMFGRHGYLWVCIACSIAVASCITHAPNAHHKFLLECNRSQQLLHKLLRNESSV